MPTRTNTIPSIPGHDFGPALVAVRRIKGMQQQELGAELGLTPRTLTRWENGESMPRVDVRDRIVLWLRSQTGPEAERALVALGAMFPSSPAAPSTPPAAPALPPEQARQAKVALEHAIYKAAEQADVPARAARQIAIAALDAMSTAALTPKQARELLTK